MPDRISTAARASSECVSHLASCQVAGLESLSWKILSVSQDFGYFLGATRSGLGGGSKFKPKGHQLGVVLGVTLGGLFAGR